jgi:S1-C subfamily serine protease
MKANFKTGLLYQLLGVITVILLFSIHLFAQDYSLPEVIEKSKKSIIPLIGLDPNWSNKFRHMGTGIVIGDRKTGKELILTCEHVISIKDSVSRKTARKVKNIYANFNLHNDSIITIPLTVVYSDENNDFALLEFSFSSLLIPKDSLHVINLLIFPFDNFDHTRDLKEGEPLLYIGYPMSLGVGLKSYPVSRKGIVAQNISDSSIFLMDGFVQGGNSGSPVFRIKQNVYTLSGIAQAYPNEIAEIRYKKVKDQDRIAIINPGFTIVKKIDIISEVLIQKFGFTKQ